MAIITLTTDLGLKDYYVSAIKGTILKQLPQANIVDISHQVPVYNIQDAAFILKNAYQNFPTGSIHIIGVKDELSPSTPHVAVEANGHFFISSDNGIFSLLLDNAPDKVIELTIDSGNSYLTFPTRDVFAMAACKLAKGDSIDSLGQPKTQLLQRIPFRAANIGNMIKGTVTYIDSYGNVITNISERLFSEIGKGKEFRIEFARYSINKISKQYNNEREGEILALFNSAGMLEIAMNNDKASSMLNLKLNDSITVHFQ